MMACIYFPTHTTEMNAFGLLEICGAISLAFLYSSLIQCNVIGEWEFQNFHPDLENLHWKELDRLTEEDRKRMCLEVYEGQLPIMLAQDDYYDDEDESNSTMKSATVLTNCKVRFRNGLVPMSLIECNDTRLTFYLAQGDERHVFMLRSELDDDTYSFLGVMQNVTYPSVCQS